ncbi:MAG: type IV pilus twitching motility protein PilT [Calditrichia bacterium]
MTTSSDMAMEARDLLNRLKKQIPSSLLEIERQYFINDKILSKLTLPEVEALRNYMNDILMLMRDYEASDIEMGGSSANCHIWLRIKGEKSPAEQFGRFDIDDFSILILCVLAPEQREQLFEKLSYDFSYTIMGLGDTRIRYRACVYFELGDIALNMRAINAKIRSYESYGFGMNVTKMFSLEHTKAGLVLVTGITGSGKSTTLDAIVDMNNETVEGHIVIIARPIEFVHRSKKCIVRQREVGMDTLSFKNGTIEALRQDPDIIVIGEMRDSQTIMSALEAADSGHKVLSTLHTSSAVESLDRIVGEVPPIEQERVRNRLADTLKCVVSQKLVVGRNSQVQLVKEILVMTPSIKAAIRNNNTSEIYQMISEGTKYGMMTLEQDLKRFVRQRKISAETAIKFANNKRRMQQLLN